AARPVQLGGDVVDGALADPGAGVGVLGAVGLQPLRTGAVRVVFGIAPDTERRDPEPHPGLGVLDALVDAGDQGVDVVAAPVGAAVEAVAAALEAVVVVDLLPLGGVGV